MLMTTSMQFTSISSTTLKEGDLALVFFSVHEIYVLHDFFLLIETGAHDHHRYFAAAVHFNQLHDAEAGKPGRPLSTPYSDRQLLGDFARTDRDKTCVYQRKR